MGGVIQESFFLNLRIMRAFGLYAPNKNRRLYKLQAYIMYIIFITQVPLLGCLYLLLEENIDLARVSENAFLLAEMGCFITKFLPIINGNKEFKECILYFETPLFERFNDAHGHILEDCKKICRRNTIYFLISVIAGLISWAVKPLFGDCCRLPVDVWVPFDFTSTRYVYYSVYIYIVIQVSYAAVSSGVVDPLIAGLACQATGQLRILKHCLQNLSESRNVYENIKLCVDHHNAILEFVKIYENCFSTVVFSQFVGSVIVICVSCLQLIMMESLSFNFIAMVMYLVAMLAQIYLFCYYGTTLYEESDSIIESIYMGKWYDYSMESKNALLILMERAQKPMIVTAGKILDLSLVTFTTILRRSYSLLAVLQNYK